MKACMVTQQSITVTQTGRGGGRADRRQAQQDQSKNIPQGEKWLTPFNQLSCRQTESQAVGVFLQAQQKKRKTHIFGFTGDNLIWGAAESIWKTVFTAFSANIENTERLKFGDGKSD